MVKLNYTDEKNFITEEIEFSDDHYLLAKKIHELYEGGIDKKTPLMVKNDKKSLLFCVDVSDVNTNRVDRENGKNKYKIIIEKI